MPGRLARDHTRNDPRAYGSDQPADTSGFDDRARPQYVHPGDRSGGLYHLYAANQAEKAADITLVDASAVGAFGRLIVSGRESDVDEAAAAALAAVKNPSGT